MKILIVNTYDIQGGAARAAMRLHLALINNGIDSKMLVQKKSSDDITILGKNNYTNKILSKVRSYADSLPVKFYRKRSKSLFSPAWITNRNIVREINKSGADIVHLHWLNNGMLSIEDLAKIEAPIVWTLHDMWPFTGGCHYSDGCERFKKNCGSCVVLGSNKDSDLSRIIYKRKLNAYSKIKHLTIIGLSNWLNSYSKDSSLFKSRNHINLPNPINTDIFKPFDKNQARILWNLPKDKKLILFGAMSATSDPRKGFEELNQSLKEISEHDVELVIFGGGKPREHQYFNNKTHFIGSVNDDVSLVSLYSAADVMIVPSLQENLSNVIMESLSCGTPVVAFDIGGNGDMIDHKKNGYLAKPNNNNDLAKGIDFILYNSDFSNIQINARDKIVSEFNEEIVVHKYIKLYEKIYQESK